MYHDDDDYDAMHYEFEITFAVRVAKWRMDDPRIKDNHNWSLEMWDVNKGEWVNLKDLNREGEYSYVDKIVVVSGDKKLRVPQLPQKTTKVS